MGGSIVFVYNRYVRYIYYSSTVKIMAKCRETDYHLGKKQYKCLISRGTVNRASAIGLDHVNYPWVLVIFFPDWYLSE